ncbi:MAG: SOS response-associated peptidase [Chloroflexota bacterium]|nr:SOS response-associated peptidase [Chloroflexota bacterium]
MCGRYDLIVIGQVLAARFRVTAEQAGEVGQNWQPRYNIAPSQLNPVVVAAENRGKDLVTMKWGLVPSWAKAPKTSFSTINARAETITQKPAFRKLLSGKRCLVPATGYFEWSASGGAGGKQPYRVQVTGDDSGEDRILAMAGLEDRILAVAGLYDVWKGQYGEPLLTYTIITNEASPGIRSLHERMPVILSREDEEVWLDPRINETEWLLSLLRPYPDTQLSTYRVGPLVNSPSNDRAELIRAA